MSERPESIHPSGDQTLSSKGPSVRPALTIAGYTIEREVSRGGQAVIYEAIQQSTTQHVAIRVLIEGRFASDSDRARFEREVQILAALNHPNIVRVLDRGQTADGSEYLVMNYIAGKPLDKHLEQRNPEQRVRLELFMKIADAVNMAHLRGIVHRDLKPSNILVDESGEPYVLDFGLARAGLASDANNPVTVSGQFLGSLPWASPEQAEGHVSNIDIRSDVYSLGVVLYQILTGRFPYDVTGSMREVLNNICTIEPTPPSKAMSAVEASKTQKGLKLTRMHRIDPALEAIVLKALAKKKEDRYQSAGDMARDVASYLSGRPTVAAGKPPTNWRPIIVVGAAAAGLIAVAVGLSIALFQRPSSSAPPSLVAGRPTTPPAASTASGSDRPSRAAVSTPALAPAPSTPAPAGTILAKLGSMNLSNHPVPVLAFSPDGKSAAFGSWDHGIHLLDVATWSGQHIFEGHQTNVSAAAFSPDGRTLASSDRDGVIHLWDAVTGEVRAKFVDPQTGYVRSVRFTPDGAALVFTCGDGTVRSWDLTSGAKSVVFRKVSRPWGLHIPPDGGTWIVSSASGTVYLLDAATGKQLTTMQVRNESEWGASLACSPDGRWLYTGAIRTIGVWDARTGISQASYKLSDEDSIRAMALSPDGRLLALGGTDGKLTLWDTQTHQVTGVFPSPDAAMVQCLAFSPDGSKLAIGKINGDAWLWRVNRDQPAAAPASFPFDPDEHVVFSDTFDGAVEWGNPGNNVVISEGVARNTGLKGTSALLRQGIPRTELSLGDVRVYVRTRAAQSEQTASVFVWLSSRVDPKGSLLGFVRLRPEGYIDFNCVPARDQGGRDGTSHATLDAVPPAFATKDGQFEALYRYEIHRGDKDVVTMSLDCYDAGLRSWRRLASANQTDIPNIPAELRTWRDAHSAFDTLTIQFEVSNSTVGVDAIAITQEISAPARAPASSPPSVASEASAAAPGAGLRKVNVAYLDKNCVTYQLAFFPDGQTVVAACADRLVRLVDVPTWTVRRSLQSHRTQVQTVAVSPDGRTIVSGDRSGDICFWDAATGALRLTRSAHQSRVGKLLITSDSAAVLSAGENGTIVSQDIATGAPHGVARLAKGLCGFFVSPDGGTWMAMAVDGTVDFLDAATGKSRRTIQVDNFNDQSVSWTWSPDRRWLYTGTLDTLSVWDAQTGARQDTYKLSNTKDCFGCTAMSPDGRLLIASGRNRKLTAWDTQTRQVVGVYPSEKNGVATCLAFSSDGSRLAVAQMDGFLTLWEVAAAAPAVTTPTPAREPASSPPVVAPPPTATQPAQAGIPAAGLPFAFDPGERVLFGDDFEANHGDWEFHGSEDRVEIRDGVMRKVSDDVQAAPEHLMLPGALAQGAIRVYVLTRSTGPAGATLSLRLRGQGTRQSVGLHYIQAVEGTFTCPAAGTGLMNVRFSCNEKQPESPETAKRAQGGYAASYRLDVHGDEQGSLRVSWNWYDANALAWRELATTDRPTNPLGPKAKRPQIDPNIVFAALTIEMPGSTQKSAAIDAVAVTIRPKPAGH